MKRTGRLFLAVFSLLVVLLLLASGPLMACGWLKPLAHQRIGYIGTPFVIWWLFLALAREIRQ